MTKLPIPNGPSGLARRFQVNDKAAGRHLGSPKLSIPPKSKRKAAAKKAVAEVTVTKAEKVAAWRKANPEAFAAQKQRAAERRKAKEGK